MENKKKTKNLFSASVELQEKISKSLNEENNIESDVFVSSKKEMQAISVSSKGNQKTEKIRLSSGLYNEVKEIVVISKIVSPDKKISIKSYIESIVEKYLLENKKEILSQRKTAIKKINIHND